MQEMSMSNTGAKKLESVNSPIPKEPFSSTGKIVEMRKRNKGKIVGEG